LSAPADTTAGGSRAAISGYSVAAGTLSLSGRDLAGFLTAGIERRKPFRFTARGFSMSPFVRDGDVITVVPMDRPPRVGDVVAFRYEQPQRLAVHRIVALLPRSCVVRGDNAIAPDGLVARSDVLGRVARCERAGRSVALGVRAGGRMVAALSARGLLVPSVGLVRRGAAPLRLLSRRGAARR